MKEQNRNKTKIKAITDLEVMLQKIDYIICKLEIYDQWQKFLAVCKIESFPVKEYYRQGFEFKCLDSKLSRSLKIWYGKIVFCFSMTDMSWFDFTCWGYFFHCFSFFPGDCQSIWVSVLQD